MRFDAEVLARLAARAEALGLMRLGAVRLDHAGFEPAQAALDRFFDRGYEGEMEFLRRTAAVRKDPAQMLEGAKTALIAAVPYRGESGHGVARYARGVDYHSEMFLRLDALAQALREEVPGAHTLVCVDTKPLQERAAAALAGLGFIGKHGCVIVPGLGSYVLLGALLTDAAWGGDDPFARLSEVTWDACGSCSRCLDACPTQAFDAPGVLDPRRCISYLTIEHRGPIDDALASEMGAWVAGCDVCQEVCPYNASARREQRVPEQAWLSDLPEGPRDADPVVLAQLGSSRHRAFVRNTALRRIPRRALRRNALLVIGNRDGPLTDREEDAVIAAETDDDPQIRAAAARVRARRR